MVNETRGHEWAGDDIIDFANQSGSPPNNKPKKWKVIIGGLVILMAILIMTLITIMPGENFEDYEQQAKAAFISGEYEKSLEICQNLQDKFPDRSLSWIILGKINFYNGDLESSKIFFQRAFTAKQASNIDKSEAQIGLGRIASILDKTNEALKSYGLAVELAPQKSSGYLSQAMLMSRNNKPNEAAKLFQNARGKFPVELGSDVIERYFIENAKATLNYMKQERVNQLVNELISKNDSNDYALTPETWTSTPLTVWFIQPESIGYSFEEGKDELMFSGINGRLIEDKRIRIVERAILDKLLDELKVGSSSLSKKGISLKIGRILAARVIISGKLIYSGPENQILLRMIDTESTQVIGSVNVTFNRSTTSKTAANLISKKILKILSESYPLRGEIISLSEKNVIINVGRNMGMKIGDRVKTVEKDEVVIELSEVNSDKSGKEASLVKSKRC